MSGDEGQTSNEEDLGTGGGAVKAFVKGWWAGGDGVSQEGKLDGDLLKGAFAAGDGVEEGEQKGVWTEFFAGTLDELADARELRNGLGKGAEK